MSQKVVLLDDGLMAFGLGARRTHSLPSPDIHQLRVLLE
jgi:hypothetical protein